MVNKSTQKQRQPKSATGRRRQLSSFVLLVVSVAAVATLCPFDLGRRQQDLRDLGHDRDLQSSSQLSRLDSCLRFVGRVLTLDLAVADRPSVLLAEAKVLGKMAKVWYIKKKIKKLNKKLKKHTIAVPIITAIPIYEHSYYPQPYAMSHGGGGGGGGGGMYHSAASFYSPAAAVAPPAMGASGAATSAQQLVAAASNHHPMIAGYRMPGGHNHHHHHSDQQYNPAAQTIINSYQPAPPLFVDESGGLYGHYGNAYGRYDGGYQYW